MKLFDIKSANHRRDFLKISASSFLATLPTWALGNEAYVSERITALEKDYSANDNINIALIGSGGRGLYDTERALAQPGVNLVATCDVYDGRTVRSKELFGNHLFTTRHYEDILARKDVDAVIIAGTHHWNAKMVIDSLNAGKHVFVEKPMIQKVEEGPQVVAAEKANKKVLMVGSQRVSSIVYDKAKELYNKGAIGELNYVEAWWDRFSHLGAWQYSIAPDASPKNIDWQRFLGDAPQREFDPIRLFRWRNYKDYGTGVAGDLFVHLFSGLHHVISSNGPERIYSSGGIRFWKDGRDVPDFLLTTCDYPKTKSHPAFTLLLRTNFADGSGGSTGFRFIGSEGMMTVDNNVTITSKKLDPPGYNIHSFPEDVQKEYKAQHNAKYPPTRPKMNEPTKLEYTTPKGYNDLDDHLFNFFTAIRKGGKVVEDGTYGFRAAAPAILSHQSHYDGKTYLWNPNEMKIKA